MVVLICLPLVSQLVLRKEVATTDLQVVLFLSVKASIQTQQLGLSKEPPHTHTSWNLMPATKLAF